MKIKMGKQRNNEKASERQIESVDWKTKAEVKKWATTISSEALKHSSTETNRMKENKNIYVLCIANHVKRVIRAKKQCYDGHYTIAKTKQ